MSSGAVVVAPAAVVVMAGAAVVLTAAAAAVVVVVAARAAWAAYQGADAIAEAGVRALVKHGQVLEDEAGRQSADHVAELLWESVAADVVEKNARIELLGARAARRGVSVAVPAPLSLVGVTIAEAAKWCAEADLRIAKANAAVRAAVMAEEDTTLTASLPASPGVAEALAGYQKSLREPRTPARAVVISKPSVEDVDAVVRGLDVDANDDECLTVLTAAALVAAADVHTAHTYLQSLRTTVSAVNATVERRRRAARLLVSLEMVEPPEPFSDTASKLRAVIADGGELTPELMDEAKQAIDAAERDAHRAYLRETMTGCLKGLGYTVAEGFDVWESGDLRLTRAEWRGEHAVTVWMDHQGVQGRVVRTTAVGGAEALAVEKARCDQFNADLTAVGRELCTDVATDDGYVPQTATAPGIGSGVHRPSVLYHDR